MTVIAHPASRTVELNRRIGEELAGQACWKADLLWDVSLTLEFGLRRILIGKDGPVAFGEFRILLEDAPWTAVLNGEVIFNSDDAQDTIDNGPLDEVFVGHHLMRVDWHDGFSLVFSNDLVLRCYPQDADEKVFELRFANGDYIDLYADGRIEVESTGQ